MDIIPLTELYFDSCMHFPLPADPDINLSESSLFNCGATFKCLILTNFFFLLQTISSCGILCLIQPHTLYLGERFRILAPCKHLVTHSCTHYTSFLLVTIPKSQVGMEKCLTQYRSWAQQIFIEQLVSARLWIQRWINGTWPVPSWSWQFLGTERLVNKSLQCM